MLGPRRDRTQRFFMNRRFSDLILEPLPKVVRQCHLRPSSGSQSRITPLYCTKSVLAVAIASFLAWHITALRTYMTTTRPSCTGRWHCGSRRGQRIQHIASHCFVPLHCSSLLHSAWISAGRGFGCRSHWRCHRTSTFALRVQLVIRSRYYPGGRGLREIRILYLIPRIYDLVCWLRGVAERWSMELGECKRGGGVSSGRSDVSSLSALRSSRLENAKLDSDYSWIVAQFFPSSLHAILPISTLHA
jgi:hypothetical protein